MSGKDHRQALIRSIEQSYLEIFPAQGIEDRLELSESKRASRVSARACLKRRDRLRVDPPSDYVRPRSDWILSQIEMLDGPS